MKQFTSSGKLLLTAEYSVLQGAEAIAIPTKLGQKLIVKSGVASGHLHWRAYDHENQLWLSADFDKDLNVEKSSNLEQANFLAALLKFAFDESSAIEAGSLVETHLDFNRKWGLGSSSTLVHLIAQWARCEPMSLFFKVFKGSGYDVAVALENTSIKYHILGGKPNWKPVGIPELFNQTKLVYLQQKQDSQLEIKRFGQKTLSIESIDRITALSKQILEVQSLTELAEVFDEHEAITSRFLERPRIKDVLFPDFKGHIKSLGAWGGDFIWVIPQPEQAEYFTKKGYGTELDFSQLVKS